MGYIFYIFRSSYFTVTPLCSHGNQGGHCHKSQGTGEHRNKVTFGRFGITQEVNQGLTKLPLSSDGGLANRPLMIKTIYSRTYQT